MHGWDAWTPLRLNLSLTLPIGALPLWCPAFGGTVTPTTWGNSFPMPLLVLVQAKLAGTPGLEPGYQDPNSRVLPLDDIPIVLIIILSKIVETGLAPVRLDCHYPLPA